MSLTTARSPPIGTGEGSRQQVELPLPILPGLSGAELARRLLISPQGVQLAITALERRGLVERKQDPQHGRILQTYLTDQGRAVVAAVLADALAAHDQVFGVLDPGERQLLHDLLARVVEQGTGNPLFTDHTEA